jgi:predicted glycosyltransferase
MRILFYCQHVLGIGHFFRSMEIARALNRHEILFAGGGESLEGMIAPDHVEMLNLPPLMMDPEFRNMLSRDGSLDEIREKRRRILSEGFSAFGPDLILTELFPFGRRQFRFELIPLLESARQRGSQRPVKVVCSLRDILVEKDGKPGYQAEVLDTLNRYYDLLLVHSDPAIVKLDETFERFGEIGIPVEYTGFVARPAPARTDKGGNQVIVTSSGGGRVGADLLAASIEAVRKIPRADLELRIFMGPFIEDSDRLVLEKAASSDPRISLRPFSLDFLSEMVQADLSISMAGYNTCMDILSSGVAALVYPFSQNREQAMRAAKLERMGLLRVIASLDPNLLRRQMETMLEESERNGRNRDFSINLSGAGNAAVLIDKLMAGTVESGPIGIR